MVTTKRLRKTQSGGLPFKVKRGELVRIVTRIRNECVGWQWCEKSDGRQGWIPEAYLSKREEGSMLTMDFTGEDLTGEAGQSVSVLIEHLGRAFCQISAGGKGWLHIDLLE